MDAPRTVHFGHESRQRRNNKSRIFRREAGDEDRRAATGYCRYKNKTARHVLIVDDDPEWLIVMECAIRRQFSDVDVRLAETVGDAINFLNKGPIDLVFTDVRLDGGYGTGVDVARAARHRGIRVVAMSAFAVAPPGVEMIMKDKIIDELTRIVIG